ncbi:e3 ubiquitin-protein ligase MARCHF3 [Trichonephila clavata]|uniref:E3 ubiquitin-protein ligase MARCHF3 n=1 Tax=Trichonephila clavata TaxID=2740835 RepID=A0A8X6JDD0_TRICU|nr:e3 ubiquitin-protein ligase MARCHF3 [Trichonephila clavata]
MKNLININIVILTLYVCSNDKKMAAVNKDSENISKPVERGAFDLPPSEVHIQKASEKCANGSQVESNSIQSATCRITPPNIHISHMYVYNFTPDQKGRKSSTFDTPVKSSKYQSPAASSGPICRICHEGDGKEDLVSPCRCTGTVGLVHKSCMERWLSTRANSNDKCEICNYTFVTARYPKSLLEWIRSDENSGSQRRGLMGDLTCFLLLTPLAVVSSFLCVEGAKRQVVWGNSLEAGCLMALATFLITVYFVWNMLTVRYHMKIFLRWRLKNQNVKLLRVQRISTATESGSNSYRVETMAPEVLARNGSPSVSITISDSERNG